MSFALLNLRWQVTRITETLTPVQLDHAHARRVDARVGAPAIVLGRVHGYCRAHSQRLTELKPALCPRKPR